MPPAAADRLYEVIQHVRPLHQYSAKAVALELAGTGVSVPLRAVLERLADDGPRTVPSVARSLWVSRQFVQRLADDAVRQGLLRAAPNPDHKRSPLLELTGTGADMIQAIRAREAGNLARAAQGLDADDVEAAVRVLGHLTKFLRDLVADRPDEGAWEAPGPLLGEDIR